MPIYEYQCKSCGHVLETIQKISDAPLTECPACQRPDLAKQVTAAAFRLKGGGWYETDFKSEGDKKKNLAGEGASTSGKPAASTDAAPATSPAAAAPASNSAT